jgi:hypothetical protein
MCVSFRLRIELPTNMVIYGTVPGTFRSMNVDLIRI